MNLKPEGPSPSIPWVGRIVHLRVGDECVAAMVTGLLGYTGNVDLTTFTGHHTGTLGGVAFDPDRADDTWHYPNARCTTEAAEAPTPIASSR